MGPIRYPRYSYSQIQGEASAFLTKYHPSGATPVAIERLIEIQLGIDIVPFPGLHQAFDTDGFTTSDLSAIYVEEVRLQERPHPLPIHARPRARACHPARRLLCFPWLAEHRGVEGDNPGDP